MVPRSCELALISASFINTIADDESLKLAASAKLIPSENAGLLGEAIYMLQFYCPWQGELPIFA
jgi:hypothetical protein